MGHMEAVLGIEVHLDWFNGAKPWERLKHAMEEHEREGESVPLLGWHELQHDDQIRARFFGRSTHSGKKGSDG